MNFMDLKNINIDLKSIDLASFKRILTQRQDIAANLALVLFSFFLMFRIYSDRQHEAVVLKTRVADLEQKIEAISQHEKAAQELDGFVKALPEGIAPSNIIDKLNDFAEKRKVRIESFLPAGSQSQALYEKSSVLLNISADSYQDLWLFVYDIETSPYNLRVDRFSGSSQSIRQGPGTQQSGQEKLYAQMEITAIYFKK